MFQSYWSNLHGLTDQQVAQRIITGATSLDRFEPYYDTVYKMGDQNKEQMFLDFGCGLGRNMSAFITSSSLWKVIGYDNPAMIERARLFMSSRHEDISRMEFVSDWKSLKNLRFDGILSCLVFQHMHPSDVAEVLQEMKPMSDLLHVTTRRYFDEGGGNVPKAVLEHFEIIDYKGADLFDGPRDAHFYFKCRPRI
jgi:SAM-dependent methyltransferase